MSTTLPHPEVLRLSLADDPAATERLGERLGRQLRPGDTLALVGDLGSGKTTLVRGLARGLAIDDPDAVASPTYLLVVEHPGPVPLLHADAYLPDKLAGFLADGGLEYLFAPGALAAVEWADLIREHIPDGALWLQLSVPTGGGRCASFRCRRGEDFPWLGDLDDNSP
jgi:tRNA threonylcarbamoyladenosine biosynthesis protein TsaE